METSNLLNGMFYPVGEIHLQSARRGGAVLAGHSAPSRYIPFTYTLQQRRRAGHSVPIPYAPSRSDSLTDCSTEIRQYQPATPHYTPSRSDSLTSYSSQGGKC